MLGDLVFFLFAREPRRAQRKNPEVDARGTPPRVYTKGKDKRLTAQKTKKRLTFTFPFVHHQSHDWKVEH